jgi:hypothetical protein
MSSCVLCVKDKECLDNKWWSNCSNDNNLFVCITREEALVKLLYDNINSVSGQRVLKNFLLEKEFFPTI